MKKWQILLLVLVIVGSGLWFVNVFPDPYHKEGAVNIYTWLYREIDKLLHGEKG